VGPRGPRPHEHLILHDFRPRYPLGQHTGFAEVSKDGDSCAPTITSSPISILRQDLTSGITLSKGFLPALAWGNARKAKADYAYCSTSFDR